MKGGVSWVDAFYRQVGENICRERQALGFTQQELAQEIGLTRTSVVNIETGRQHAPLHTFVKIAQALAVPVADLLPPLREDGER